MKPDADQPQELSLTAQLRGSRKGDTFVTFRSAKHVTSFASRERMKVTTTRIRVVRPKSDKLVDATEVKVLEPWEPLAAKHP